MERKISSEMFTSDFKTEPYWWDAAPREPAEPYDIPAKVDVLIVGSGYTGLHAALKTARAGRSTLVLDAQQIGYGASSRNGGQISNSIKLNLLELTKKFGKDMAAKITIEGKASRDYIESFVKEEGLDCNFKVVGRFDGAHTPKQYEKLAKTAGEDGSFMVPLADQHSELGTDFYYGGIVRPNHASIHPALYHRGLLSLVRQAGAEVGGNCRVTSIKFQNNGYLVETPTQSVQAKRVIIATNGYTTKVTPELQKRVIPIGSYIIATEELPKDVMDRLMPKNRMLCDTRKMVFYYRPSPDRKRILFGGRVSLNESDPVATAKPLRNELIRIFPELKKVKISHSWSGFVAFTFDKLMHVGRQKEMYYAMGYCGSGVGMASYLGMKIGLMAVDDATGQTAFSEIPFLDRLYYQGNPWFMGPTISYYRLHDRLSL